MPLRPGLQFAARVSPDGRTVVVNGSGGSAIVFDVTSGSRLGTLAGQFNGSDFSRDGRLIATAGTDGVVRIWDAATRTELRALSGEPLM